MLAISAFDIALWDIAGGESLKSRYEFANRLADRVFDIIQPDIVNAGGVSEMFKIGHMANAFGVHFRPHLWGTVSDQIDVDLYSKPN